MQRVLERFGDPAAVARRLWFDAMKGKIMAQRVVIVTCLLVAIASLSLVGIVWIQSSRVAAESLEANRQYAAALAQSQSLSKDMMKTLGEMSDAIRNPRSPRLEPGHDQADRGFDRRSSRGGLVDQSAADRRPQFDDRSDDRRVGRCRFRLASSRYLLVQPFQKQKAWIAEWIWPIERRPWQQYQEADRLPQEGTLTCARSNRLQLARRPGKGAVGR